jgi:mono/diheme cytochrome c family protein
VKSAFALAAPIFAALVAMLLVAPAASAADTVAVGDASVATVARGKQAFEHRCGMCHRDGGTGTFILARRLGKEQSLLEKRGDLQPVYVRHVVRWGLVNMPRIGRVELPDADLEAVIAYLAPKP